MPRKSFIFMIAVMIVTSLCFGQEVILPIAGSDTVMIDSSSHWRIIGSYRSDNNIAFYEPTTGNLLVAYYYIGASGETDGERRIVAATSLDDGATWSVYRTINEGVTPGDMNAYYPVAYGNATTPIIAYYNRANPDANFNSEPIVATDALGWSPGGLWQNVRVDPVATDTVVDHRYHTFTIPRDNPNLWLLGGIFWEPGENVGLYRSTDGGANWSRPIQVATAVLADTLKPNYVYDWGYAATSLAIKAGPNNMVYGVFPAQEASALDKERIWFASSDDGGLTWSNPGFVPGTENLSFPSNHVYRVFATLMDAADNFHVFCIGQDTTEAANSYRIWDLRFDGETWNINKFGFPQLLNDGIAQPDVGGGPNSSDSDEEDAMNSPAVGPDGTLYYAYTDVYDTTGAAGDPQSYKYGIYVMISQDNGSTWKGPECVYQDEAWPSDYPCDMTRTASDKLHFFFKKGGDDLDQYKEMWYLSVPTQGVKDKILSVPHNVVTEVPQEYELYQNYPNPFNPQTTIRFDLNKNTHVKLTVFNLLGQHIDTIIDKDMTAGSKAVVWNASHLPSGKYFYRLQTDNFSAVKEMTLIK